VTRSRGLLGFFGSLGSDDHVLGIPLPLHALKFHAWNFAGCRRYLDLVVSSGSWGDHFILETLT
jgi:hypothetical protein